VNFKAGGHLDSSKEETKIGTTKNSENMFEQQEEGERFSNDDDSDDISDARHHRESSALDQE